MTIKGLEHSAYYLYNPIWVDVSGLQHRLQLIIINQGVSYSFTLQPIATSVRFDLSSMIQGVTNNISDKTGFINYTGVNWVVDGAYNVDIKMADAQDAGYQGTYTTLNKTFVIGGVSGYESNVVVGNSLSISNNKWSSLPSFDFKLTNNVITGTPIQAINRRKRLDCTNAYIMFRNRLGGFSSYLFEDFNITEKGKDLGYYITDNNIIDSGTELTKEINLRTKLVRQDYLLARNLISSQEVYLFESNKLTRLVGANTIGINDKLNVQDFEVSFNVPINYNSQW